MGYEASSGRTHRAPRLGTSLPVRASGSEKMNTASFKPYS
jgi:hypothetical protein